MVVERQRYGIVTGIRADVTRLHGLWMSLVFPQLRRTHSVMGRWRPRGTAQRALFRAWGALGALALLAGYPLLLLGFGTRFWSRRLDGTVARLGVVGAVVLSAVVWGLLTLVARLQFSTEGFIAVGAASVVAVVSVALAVVFARYGGRGTTVLLAYPAAMNALFLPPVVAALYSPTLAGVIFPESATLARWLLDNVLVVGDLSTTLRDAFELEGAAYVAMWFALAVPVGWLLGSVVALADAVRPTPHRSSPA
ncbi:hypothetical protein ACFQPA_08655 [Halomarina halobia]|uniref:ABC transporter permease n=1 Tax=Halomarina halobia TaxID=3033386 RepID=A0ABD6AB70_9EURY|nr:hypothetical protein [Halomarina sp. PSR21]